MSKGGSRPGAGRKPGSKAPHTIQAEAYRAELIRRVIASKGPLIDALIQKGLTGDVPALKEINERTLGKVKDVSEITGKDGKDLFPVPILANLNVSTDDSDKKDKPA
jgi:hypothetical protein